VAFRRGGPILLAFVGCGLLAMVASLGPGSLHAPLNSEIADTAMPLLLLLAWSVTVGDDALLPLFVGVASFAAQVHVATATFALPLCLVAAVAWALRTRFRPGSRRPLVVAAIVAIVAWFPVACGELASGPSNVLAIVRSALHHGRTIGPHFALERVATAVAPLPMFVRPASTVGFLHDAARWQVLVAFALLGGLGSLVVANWHRRPAASRLAGLVLLIVAFGAVTTARLPLGGAIRVDGNRWLWVASFGTWLALSWFGWLSLPDGIRRQAWQGMAVAALVIAVVASGAMIGGAHLSGERDGSSMRPERALFGRVRASLPRGTYRVRAGGDAFLSFAPALVADLEDHGYHVLVDLGAFNAAYGSARSYSGQRVDGRLFITTDAAADATSGARPLARVTVPSAVVRVYLEPS
jgi:hypothetical protein